MPCRRRKMRPLLMLSLAVLASRSHSFLLPSRITTSKQRMSATESEDTRVMSDAIESSQGDNSAIAQDDDSGLWGKTEKLKCDITERPEIAIQKQRNRNRITAVVAILLALGNYVWEYTHPITAVQLLVEMQQSSAPLSVIGTNGKPSVVDFWAPWCENCKLAAPTLRKIEEMYGDRVNFVMVNGDQPQAWPYIEAFGVDAIPHLALVNAEGDVETALIGPIPKSVLEADLNVMIENHALEKKKPLPFVMLDVFANRPEQRRVHFDP